MANMAGALQTRGCTFSPFWTVGGFELHRDLVVGTDCLGNSGVVSTSEAGVGWTLGVVRFGPGEKWEGHTWSWDSEGRSRIGGLLELRPSLT